MTQKGKSKKRQPQRSIKIGRRRINVVHVYDAIHGRGLLLFISSADVTDRMILVGNRVTHQSGAYSIVQVYTSTFNTIIGIELKPNGKSRDTRRTIGV